MQVSVTPSIGGHRRDRSPVLTPALRSPKISLPVRFGHNPCGQHQNHLAHTEVSGWAFDRLLQLARVVKQGLQQARTNSNVAAALRSHST